ncbi:GNAT family N-acetyltransferase [Halomonas sp. M4R1S46]|uniref:GNAT family N-acetyltransferase n=1 Tax=Halomonas sp. M4R1S46 TaxID=2982692 RepID=UPI0021E3F185|nr:GNAT family N-acetyltransferase [Halomonas sp. M4R1S46]UYG08665.1 GNAT family N-acetyltransferase [Halomonas sp. M4R1S46]
MAKPKQHDSDFLLRKADDADIPTLVEFLSKLAQHVAGSQTQRLKTKERQRLVEALASALADTDKLIIVAEVPGYGLVGMGDVAVWRNEGIWEQASAEVEKSGFIDDVWVEPEYRKRGIFTAILWELVAFAEHQGAQELVLEYSLANQEAKATWKTLGFKPTGVRAAAFTGNVKKILTDRSS